MIKFLLTHCRHLYNWLRAIFHWLLEARIFWLALFVATGALLFAVRKGATEPEIRLTGLVLQILGIATVAWGIRETRVLFGRPDIFALAKKWFQRVPVYGGRVVSASINVTLPGLEAHGRAYASSSASLNASVEERVSVLEKNIQHLNKRIDDTQSEMDQGFRAQSSALEKERQERSAEDQVLSAKLEATETGGLHISAMGAVWLFIGVTLSTASVELSAWLK
ncbi:MAG: hypothetical protein RKO66_17540 [Candidatus Contendobacter sp.]|nr:hypothetical protein [Candidatus Contendobacter sp.]MDS4057666.1 hypothetical protein [Candidatus Contendobacter sp.]